MALVKRRVKIQLDRVTSKGKTHHKLSMNPMDVALRSKNEEVIWHCKGASITLRFKNGTPFNPIPPGADDTDLPSGECQNKYQPTSYPYELTLTPTDGSSSITIDPEVVVDDSTPPPGGRKGARQARKSAKRNVPRRKKAGRVARKRK